MNFTTFGEMSETLPYRTSLSKPTSTPDPAVEELERSLDLLKRKYAEIEHQNDRAAGNRESALDDLSDEMTNFRSTLQRQTKLSQVLSNEKENVERRATDVLRINRQFEDSLGDLKTENRALNERLERELEKNKHMIAENSEFKGQVHGHETRLVLLEDSLKKAQREVDSVETLRRQKEKLLKDIQTNLQLISELNSASQSQKTELENYNKSAAEELLIFKDRKTELTRNLTALNEQLSGLRSANGELCAENERISKRLQEAKETYGLHLENEALLQAEKRNLIEKIQVQCEEEARLVEDITEIQANIKRLETENDQIIEQLTKINEPKIFK